MSQEGNLRLREYVLRYGLLMAGVIVGSATSEVWQRNYAEVLRRFSITSFFWGYIFPLVLIAGLIVSPDLFRIGRGIWLSITTRFRFSEILSTVSHSTEHFGTSLFYIDRSDQDFFQVTYERLGARLRLHLSRFLFREFPVVYYNVTAKSYLKWIDYLYLQLLRELQKRTGAHIIIALHFDEEVYREGFFTEMYRERYENLFKQAKEITEKVVGSEADIVDERWFLERGREGARRFTDFFYGIMIAKINDLVVRVESCALSFNDFYRLETNLVSSLSTILSAKRYGHLFVLDYEGSFEIWDQTPFSEFKRQHRMFFIKCRKIEGPGGERLPAWSPNDGVNITDDTDTMRRKIEGLDLVVLDAMLDVLAVDRLIASSDQKRQSLFEKVRQIKEEVGL